MKRNSEEANHLWMILAAEIREAAGADAFTGDSEYGVVLLYGEDLVNPSSEVHIPYSALEDFLKGLRRAASKRIEA